MPREWGQGWSHSQCLHRFSRRMLRTLSLSLWRDSVPALLYRDLETLQLLREDKEQQRQRPPHAGLAWYQSKGANWGVSSSRQETSLHGSEVHAHSSSSWTAIRSWKQSKLEGLWRVNSMLRVSSCWYPYPESGIWDAEGLPQPRPGRASAFLRHLWRPSSCRGGDV